jgi:hypothetical protein
MANTYTQCYFPKTKPFREEYWEMLENNHVEFQKGGTMINHYAP